MVDFPNGDGIPGCPDCFGRGVVPVPRQPGQIGEQTRLCVCVLARDVRANVERGWPGLMDTDSAPKTDLTPFIKGNAWVTSPMVTFRAQFKHMAVRQGPKWGFLTRNDADLMSAWLTDLKEVYDPDVTQQREAMPHRAVDLELLALPPALLVIILGVKSARNSAMPEVLLETIRLRQFHGKPTWVVDQPTYPFDESHIAFSQTAYDLIERWPRLKITVAAHAPKPPKPTTKVATPPPVMSAAEALEPERERRPARVSSPSPNHNGTIGMLDLTDDAPAAPKQKKWRGRK